MSSASFLLAMFLVATFIIPSIVGAIVEQRVRWVPKTTAPCQGSIEECMEEGEFGMDSESHRRILATSQYISYKALQRNTVPCSRRGASYYNCKPGAEANPYTRGCPTITRCRNS
ncbi:rapid alkalinization factor [Vigna radiata var. radiata]|uniref:Rapid alkalinization factor n=1 Tax=Vigna radiata var. radiata TaxID=3916 RepID=A0A1S3TPF3_VIGRR|nr:rapid alkalinization factor [Vigna radiata var. radiata]